MRASKRGPFFNWHCQTVKTDHRSERNRRTCWRSRALFASNLGCQ